MKRREFLQLGAATSLAGLVAPSVHSLPTDAPQALRVISYNILACRGYPKTQKNATFLQRAQEQMIVRVAQELSLYVPDIVTFQESPSEAVVAAIAQEMGMNYAFFPGGWPGNDNWPGGFPGTVMTRFPIVEQENCPLAEGERPEDLFTRHWARAVIDTGSEQLPIYSVHLHPSDPAVRAREVTEILKVLSGALHEDASLLFLGDFNHKPDGPEYARWTEAGLLDSLAAVGDAKALTFSATLPVARIDYIWAHGPLANRLKQCRVLFEGAFRTNPADPASFALSDHVPVMAIFD